MSSGQLTEMGRVAGNGQSHPGSDNSDCVEGHPQPETKNMSFEILVVDDNLLQGMTRKAILAGLGVRIKVTQDPREALALLCEPDLRSAIRVLITDHVMPGMSGPQLVRQVREHLPLLPILVISGDPEAVQAYAGLETEFQLKPVPPDLLIDTVTLMLGSDVRRSA